MKSKRIPADSSAGLTRRRFVKNVVLGLSVATLPATLRAAAPRRWRFLSEAEATLVDAITEQIIPADQDPGARDVGVVNFIDKQLAGRHRRHQQAYRNGLRGVEETSHTMFDREFIALTPAQQTEVLRSLESGKVAGGAWRQQSAAVFFKLIRDHTMQGFYGSPSHGGNRGYASYRMLRLDYPQIIGRNRPRRE